MDLTGLNNEQHEAVTAPLGPVLVVAGAGSGKTKVLTTRIVYLYEELHIRQDKILSITFTNKAAQEMKNRIANMVSSTYFNWIGTYHSTCLRFLKEEIPFLNRKSDFTIIDDEDQLLLLKEICKAGGISSLDIKPKKLLGHISKVKSLDIDIKNIISIDKAKELGIFEHRELTIVKFVYERYESKKIHDNLLDYDDLLVLTRKILIESKEIREKWQNRFEYILVDEFQDTNKIQFEILSMLINDKHNVFVVGDQDQTIYTWRGAYPYIFNDFLRNFPETKKVVLNKNYRSTKKILNASNSLISKNRERIKKELVTDNGYGEDVIYFNGTSSYEESMFVCSEIKDLIKKGVSYKEIAILYRSNFLSRNIETELINNSIPYYIYGGIKFYQRLEVKDILAYLKLVVNPYDEISIRRVINKPSRKIGDATLQRISEYAEKNKISFGEAIALTQNYEADIDWQRERINGFFSLIQKITEESKDKKISDIVKLIIEKTEYENYLKSLEFEERMQNVNELINSIIIFEEKTSGATITDFFNEISLYTDQKDTDNNANDSVTVMTIHMAKGMEFNNVFVIGLNENVFPSRNSLNSNALEEERRVAYVALTRSKLRLFISNAGGYSVINNEQLSPSRFIGDIHHTNYTQKSLSMRSISKVDLDWFDSNKKDVDYKKEMYEEKTVEINVGDSVSHTVFGLGLVIRMNGDQIDVLFKSPYGLKTILKNHKNVNRINR